MSGRVLPMWIFVAVALAIALIAFGIGQIVPGVGVAFVAAASTMWVAFVAMRYRRMTSR